MKPIDHLVYGVPDLKEGIDHFEHLFGVRAAFGGRHPGSGTHNALLSLGVGSYLEIIARDPEQNLPAEQLAFGAGNIKRPKLLTWAMTCTEMEPTAAAAKTMGADLGQILDGARIAQDGTQLKWRLSNPYFRPFDAIMPFLINWGNTPHPSQNTPKAGHLVKLQCAHPQAKRLGAIFDALGIDVPVGESKSAQLIAAIKTSTGTIVELS